MTLPTPRHRYPAWGRGICIQQTPGGVITAVRRLLRWSSGRPLAASRVDEPQTGSSPPWHARCGRRDAEVQALITFTGGILRTASPCPSCRRTSKRPSNPALLNVIRPPREVRTGSAVCGSRHLCPLPVDGHSRGPPPRSLIASGRNGQFSCSASDSLPLRDDAVAPDRGTCRLCRLHEYWQLAVPPSTRTIGFVSVSATPYALPAAADGNLQKLVARG